MDTSQKNEKEQIVDFIRLCFRKWYYFVISGAVCLLIAIVYLKIATPVYEVKSQVALRHDESLTGSVGKQSGGLLSMMGMGRGAENIEDETLKMSSHGNIKQVVKALDLSKKYSLVKGLGFFKQPLYDFSPVLLSVDPAVADTLTGIVTIKLHLDQAGRGQLKIKYQKEVIGRFTIDAFPATISTPIADFTLSLSQEYANYKKPFDLKIIYSNYDYMSQIYKDLIYIDFHKKNSDLISLGIKDPNPYMSKKLILEIIDTYNKNWDTDKEYVYKNTLSYMNQRLVENSLALTDADHQIQHFKDQYKLTDIEADIKFYYLQSAETQKDILSIATQINLMEIIRAFIQDENNRYGLIPFTLSIDNQTVNNFIEKYNQTVMQRDISRKNPAQSVRISDFEVMLDSQRKSLIITLDKEIEGLQTALNTVKRKDAEVNRKIGAVPSVEREYISLKREQELQQTIYIFLLEKREELGIRSVSLMPKLKIINEPYIVNKLVSPRLLRTLLTALFFAGVIAFALMYGIPYIRTIRKER